MPVNEQMIEFWNSSSSAAWADHPDRYDLMLRAIGGRVLDAAGLVEGERVLDVGCGAGGMTFEAAERVGPWGRVIGLDVSEPMLAVARRRAGEREGVVFAAGDAQVHVLDEVVDVVVSRFGVMFFDDPVAAFTQLRLGVRAGGRLAFACWQSPLANEWVSVPVGAFASVLGAPDLPPPGGPGPFAFAEPERVREVLDAAGWAQVQVAPCEERVLLGGTGRLEDAVAHFAQDGLGAAMLGKADADQGARALQALRAALQERTTDGLVRLGACAWLVTASNPAA